jgi:hypothetical protein
MPPGHMLRNGRAEDQVFDQHELLYRRYMSDHLHDNKIIDASFGFPGTSVNRSKYSQPEDALLSDGGQFDGCGVLEFAVKSIPALLVDGVGVRFVCFPRHVPLDDNYSHSEIWCEREERRGVPANPSSATKKKFRAMLSQHVRVRIAVVA